MITFYGPHTLARARILLPYKIFYFFFHFSGTIFLFTLSWKIECRATGTALMAFTAIFTLDVFICVNGTS